MRSARMILATAAASTVLALGAPGAYAAAGDDWDQTDSSYSKEQDKEHGKEHGKGDHDRPHGGVHTGGGALTAVNADDWGTAKDPKHDPETYKDKDDQSKESGGWSGKQEESGGGWSGSHEKPSGGMHTGGGALASPGMTAGGLAVLAVAGTGLYAARRKKTAGSLA
ncbi:hypothetical protein [Streptomyces griseorubiginosus]|uniref:hypothetical protein n=1 Tax=Streptomyces griseorubiginosus TaxID=67304 RepID=UPI002E822C5A|nr:hypothetical protein [Streptomyces griseorubiginosus]WUB45587.1 hypothetical protein OHN19_20420 [Streptomyces griseorubiginosus]WUB54105.1 hypothetical protein OG942_20420 [Streptomyces griseorubiginosus]